MAKKENRCYICGGRGTSKEHAPAQAFFPEDPVLRINLITVYSCEEHNEETSKDDEYVRNVIVMSIGNNSVAFKQFMEKTMKSFGRSPGLQKITTRNAQRVYAKEGGVIKPALAFEIDRGRVDRVLKKIAYAIFHHVHGEIWKRGLIVLTEYFKTESMKTDDLGKLIQFVKPMLGDFELAGTNPQVFKYKFLKPVSQDVHDQILVMKFYEGFEVWITTVAGSMTPSI